MSDTLAYQGKNPLAPTPKNLNTFDPRAFTLGVQVKNVWSEISGGHFTVTGSNALPAIETPTTGTLRKQVYASANTVMLNYEGPGTPNLLQRQQQAWLVYQRFGRR